MSVKDRLLEFVKHLNISIRQFEEECDMCNGYIQHMRKGVGKSKLENILNRYPQLNREWLLYGEGEMLKSDTYVAKLQEIEKKDVNIIRVLEEKILMLENIIEQKDKLLEQKDMLIDKLLNR